ncbi:MAG: hypothetical protein A2W90_20865 [Bacteroidetes bacterium GWF2_42_66]|nr:MAG: hypothetical protein A2W92_12460 [Bacteroidetes bacterium GWA2_42_15]OFX99194.1 MAG: hypothetical protein A2W89_03545 [Bacteroidetes bacterium GWE2_42_39]OFY40590.1 MAG: hypothetical protein A2W90_20865 [Bacteroidetes bacterium GWF2_42_66]HBL74542.1 hypothetical protein [Prolixibacteraceae bacterium]HCU61310.1 hypothetical protein [Prolixibacteraceae bacterium]
MDTPNFSERIPVSLQSHPYYFAHYLNMARHNAYVILEYVNRELIKPGKNLDEDNLIQSTVLKDGYFDRKPDELSHRNRLLVQHFPFLREAENEGARTCNPVSYKLKTALAALNQWRNNASHYPLNQNHEKDFDLQPFFSFAIEACKKRMREVFQPDDFYLLETNEKQFYTLHNENGFTEKGLYCFICFFLEKKYAFQFLAGIKGFKNTTDNKFRATLETFTEHCCRLPKPKLDSSDIKLDMLGELSRCPAPLFDLLDIEERKKFIREPEEVKPDESGDREEVQQVLMKRYDDRFPYFALRYFEEKNLLKGISFHIHIGRWIKSEHTKKIMGAERDRRLLKDIRTFGELKEFSPEHAPDYWLRDGITPDDVDQFSPQYRIVGNRIGIKLNYNGHNRWSVPDKEINVKPDAIISTYEFLNLFLYEHLYQKKLTGLSPAEFIQDYLDRFNNFLSEFKAGHIRPVGDFSLEKRRGQGDEPDLTARRKSLQKELDRFVLKGKDLPDKIREYLLGYKQKSEKKQAKWILGGMIKETVYWRNKAEQSPEKMRSGDMAQQLARDIIFLTPPHTVKEHKQKLNSLEYDVLQYALAYFSSNREKLYSFFKEHQLTVKGDRAHPFLYKIRLDECQGILDFFIVYMQQKEKWLGWLDRNLKSPRLNEEEFFNTYSYFIKTDTKRAIEMDYESCPNYLPRGIFNEPIAKALQKAGVKIKDEDNASYALSVYSNGKTQPFYNKERYYNKGIFRMEELPEKLQPKELLGKIQWTIKSSGKDTEEFRSLQNLKNRILNTEKEIRYVQSTDRALWIMVADLFPETFELRPDDLECIGHDLSDDLLSRPYQMKEKVYNYTITDYLPIKRYGEFRRFLKDRRLENLLTYFEEGVPLHREALVAELEAYDLQRKNLLEIIYRFEKLVFDRHRHELTFSGEGENQYVNHWDYLDFVARKYGLSAEVKELNSERFTELRNKMLHNQIPYQLWIKEAIAAREENTVCGRIMGMIGEIYERMTTEIEKQMQV